MTNPLLSVEQLGRYLGRIVQCECLNLNGDWQTYANIVLSPTILSQYAETREDGYPFFRNIRPVLRKLESLTGNEARGCFQFAFGWANELPVSKRVDEDHIVLESNQTRLFLSLHGVVKAENWYEQHEPMPIYFNAVALIDFLDSLGVDIRNQIASGLAVEASGRMAG